MKWPGIVRFESSDELEIIDSQQSWDAFLPTANTDCQLILSDGVAYDISISTEANPSLTAIDETVQVDTVVELARKHMAAQALCCVSKFNASSVEAAITALLQLDD